MGKGADRTMQERTGASILQAGNERRQEDINPNDRREAIHRVPKNHWQAERKIIRLVKDGTLEIDTEGKVWRLKRKLGCRWHGTKIIEVTRQRAEHRIPSGYLQVRAMIDGRRIHAFAHRLVWQFFFGDIPLGLVTNHKNGIKDDNRPDNLEIVTYSENMKHAHRNRLLDQRGERNPNAKLSDRQVEEIRELYATGEFYQADLALRYSVSFQAVSKIIRGERRPIQGGPTDPSDHRCDYMERDAKSGQFTSLRKTREATR